MHISQSTFPHFAQVKIFVKQMMDSYDIIQQKKSSEHVYSSFSSKETAATSSIMELLSYIYM